MMPDAEASTQQALASTAAAQRHLKRRTLLRVVIVSGLMLGLGLFLVWLPPLSRDALLSSLAANQLLIASLFGFNLVAVSLLWAGGPRFDL